jgi:hypothetical protein
MIGLSALVLCLLVSSPASSAEPTTLKAIGVIERYEATTHTLVIATSIDEKRFTIESTVRIRLGRHMLDASQLGELIGCRVSVRYLDGTDRLTVESVHVWQRRGDPATTAE